jgi:hypothetical protein
VPLKKEVSKKDAELKNDVTPKKDVVPKKEVRNDILVGKSKGQGKDPPKMEQRGPVGPKKPEKGKKGFVT